MDKGLFVNQMLTRYSLSGMNEEEFEWSPEEEAPEKRHGCLIQLIYGVLIIAIIVFIIMAVHPSAITGIVDSLVSWYNSNFKYDYTFTQCSEGQWETINYIGGDGQRISLFNCNDAHDPTWEELMAFLWQDETDRILYVPRESGDDAFVCSDFAETLHNQAEAVGIRVAYVHIGFAESTGHACNAFNTVDKGLVAIDCTGSNKSLSSWCALDSVVQIDVGANYMPDPLFPCYSIKRVKQSMGIITDYELVW